MRLAACILQSVCAAVFLLDLAFLVVLMQQQNPYSFECQPARFSGWNTHYSLTTWGVFFALALLLVHLQGRIRELRSLPCLSRSITLHFPKNSVNN
jgi:hypothetical protein